MDGYNGETELIAPVGDDVVRMHGQVWRVRAKVPVRIEAITEPSGAPLGASNWRAAYLGACGVALFAEDIAGGGLWVVQVRDLAYPCADGVGEGGLRRTRDMLRSSTGVLEVDEAAGLFVLATRRTRYVFRRTAEL